MRHLTSLTLMFLLLIIPSIVSDEIGTGYVKNPVFVPANGGIVKNPCVVYDQSGFELADLASAYKMWFATENGIAFAYSADGFAWTEYNNSQPLSGLHPTADLPYVIYDKDTFGGTGYHYRVWYWSGITDSIEAIRTAESIDGILWENDRPIQQHLSDPTLQLVTNPGNNNEYFHYCYGPGSILYNPNGTDAGSATPNDKSDDQPMTYRYVMYYNSSSDGSSLETGGIQTSLAYSSDGTYWIRYTNAPFKDAKGNEVDCFNAHVIRENGKYQMFYSSCDKYQQSIPNSSTVGLSSSPDGISWRSRPEAKLAINIKSKSNTKTILGSSILPTLINGARGYKIWIAVKNESGQYAINYHEIKNDDPVGGMSYFEGTFAGYAPFDAHFQGYSTACDFAWCDLEDQHWYWDFGDGNTTDGISLTTVNHTYTKPGKYTLKVSVICWGTTELDSQTATVYVFNPKDYSPCGEPKSIWVDKCEGYAPFAFMAWVKRDEMDGCLYSGSDHYWRWDFGDGTGEDDWEKWSVSHVYEYPGIYIITATGYCDYDNLQFSDTQIIVVNAGRPSPFETVLPCFIIKQESSFAPSIINFDSSCSIIPSSFAIVSFLWDFGDGQQTSGTNPSINHEYTNPGHYTVTLQITDLTGITYSNSQTITVKGLFAPSGITLEKQVNKSLFSAKAQNVLRWSPNSLIFECTVAQYKIYRKLSSQPDSDYQLIIAVDSSTFTYTDTNIELNSNYSYVLTAVETGGHESPFSNPVENRN